MEKQTILFVDDDTTLQQLVSIMLQRAGYQVVVAKNGQEGLNILVDLHPHLIMIDYTMPGITGYEVFRRITTEPIYAHLRQVPVIMLSGHLDDIVDPQALYDLGLAAYLNKPFNNRDLLSTIENILTRQTHNRF
jgi:two-component system phosphate regulon response regulator PhoB